MNKVLFLFFFFPLAIISQNKYSHNEIKLNNDSSLVVLKANDEPITGVVYQSIIDNTYTYHETTYLNGKETSCIGYFKNGKTHHYNNNGDFKIFYINSKLKDEGNMINGKKEGEWKSYYKSGKLKEKGKYIQGMGDGLWEGYYNKGGELYWKGHYKAGFLDGIIKYYRKNGIVKEEGNYKYGEKDGVWKIYHRNGEIKKEIQYKNGKEIR